MSEHPALAITPEISDLLAQHVPVAFGVSGGKDSSAVALATSMYLDETGHRGPRLLVHSDLGRIEWQASLPLCQRLADRLGLELLVVRRAAGELLERWHVRWQHNVERYRQLACVKLILPWSTASMRFCTSELKTALICRALVERFPGQTSLSVSGIRREESAQRRHAPVTQAQPRLTSATHLTRGYDWHPLVDWTREEVLASHQAAQFPLHDAYTVYGSSRVSCAFCILGSRADLMASATCADHQGIYRELVELEIASTFSFQDCQWLGDIAPHLLEDGMRIRLQDAKRRAIQREAAEALIPRQLWYTRGWPTARPTRGEANLLADVRWLVAEIMGFAVEYTEPDAVLERYRHLMEMSACRQNTSILREDTCRPGRKQPDEHTVSSLSDS
ncbi:MAG TPA: phosphoadenosine phosphosulfate reductase family protein [Ktedonobacteraceae bacterium]